MMNRGGGDNNILILNNEEYQDILRTANPPIYTREDIDYESEEDLTISIYELFEEDINDITNSINNVGYAPIKIGLNAGNILLIDKFEDLNNHYEYNGDMLQDVKIHIHKTAVIIPIMSGVFE